ncbi:MAG: hypothetical protein JWQ40_4074 [Segetibacter sp.]|nr:hypothetical protein [Segetibacter sp.]
MSGIGCFSRFTFEVSLTKTNYLQRKHIGDDAFISRR